MKEFVDRLRGSWSLLEQSREQRRSAWEEKFNSQRRKPTSERSPKQQEVLQHAQPFILLGLVLGIVFLTILHLPLLGLAVAAGVLMALRQLLPAALVLLVIVVFGALFGVFVSFEPFHVSFWLVALLLVVALGRFASHSTRLVVTGAVAGLYLASMLAGVDFFHGWFVLLALMLVVGVGAVLWITYRTAPLVDVALATLALALLFGPLIFFSDQGFAWPAVEVGGVVVELTQLWHLIVLTALSTVVGAMVPDKAPESSEETAESTPTAESSESPASDQPTRVVPPTLGRFRHDEQTRELLTRLIEADLVETILTEGDSAREWDRERLEDLDTDPEDLASAGISIEKFEEERREYIIARIQEAHDVHEREKQGHKKDSGHQFQNPPVYSPKGQFVRSTLTQLGITSEHLRQNSITPDQT